MSWWCLTLMDMDGVGAGMQILKNAGGGGRLEKASIPPRHKAWR